MTKKFQSKTLPSDFKSMESFIIDNKIELTEQVISSIEYAITNDLSDVEVFNFKGTDFIVILNISTFKENLDNIYKYYISIEKYEFCSRIKKLQQLLNQKKSNEQKKNLKRHKSKNSSKHKNKGLDSN